MTDNSSKELQDYFLTSMEYKNYVSNGYQIIFVNYVRFLEFSIRDLEDFRSELIINNNSNIHAISQEDLEKYVGTYKATKTEINGEEIENTSIYEVSARDNFLRATPVIDQNQFTDFFYVKNNTFNEITNEQNINTIVAQLDVDSNVIGFKSTSESNQGKIVMYVTKQIINNKDQ